MQHNAPDDPTQPPETAPSPAAAPSPEASKPPARDAHGLTLAELRPVDEHAAAVAALLPHTEPINLPLQQALGRVLAADIEATVSLPPFDNSAMDGYAVRRAEITAIGCALPVTADIPAGASDIAPLAPGTAARIMTGAPVPAGADFVIPVEFTDGGTTTVTITGLPDGEQPNIRPRGDDIHAGTTVLTAGTVIGPTAIGVAAAVGHATVPVFRPVTVLVISTGSELAEPGTPLAPGQIYESNGQMLTAAVTATGAHARTAHFVADDVAAFRDTIRRHIDGVDLILTSGGVSAGAYEVVKDALTGAGVTFAKVAMQPGMPQGCGIYDGTPVVTLPGNPVSSFISFEVFVRPVLRAAMGMPDRARPTMLLPLSEPIESPGSKRQFRRGVLDAVHGTVAPIGAAGSHLLGALAQADCLIVVPEEITHLEAGAEVEVWLLEG